MLLYTIHHDPAWTAPPALGPFVVGRDDRDGDTIGDRHSFAEMRCHYWVWRNRSADYVAFHHYRRALIYPFAEVPRKIRHTAALFPQTAAIRCDNKAYDEYMAAVAPVVSFQGVDYTGDDMIIPRAAAISSCEMVELGTNPARVVNLATQYRAIHGDLGWDEFESACRKESLEPRLPYLIPYNIFAMRWTLFEEYMTLWWRVMNRLRIDVPDDPYQSRVHGFLSERLFTMWVADLKMRQPTIRIREVPVLFCAD